MRLKQFDVDPADVDADGIAQAQTLGGAGNLTLNGALGITLDYARQLVITSVGNDSGITFTITGTDANGQTLTEVVTGPNATSVETSGYFKTITTIAASGATAADVTVGTVDEISTQTIPTDRASNSGVAIGVTVTGTIDYTVQETFDDVQSDAQAAQWHNITALAAKTASLVGVGTPGASAIRLVVNSYTSGAEVQMDISQPTRG